MRSRSSSFGSLALSAILVLTACQDDEKLCYVLVNVQFQSESIVVDQLRIRGVPQGYVTAPKESLLPDPAGPDFVQSVNLVLNVPESWHDVTVRLTAEGLDNGGVTSHGQTSVIPERGAIVEATILLVAGQSPCGNGMVDGGEQCDGTDLAGQTCEFRTGLPDGALVCYECELDDSRCHDCGNGLIEAGPEQCDGENLGGESCVSLGFARGTLRCGADCRLDRSLCEQGCGNGRAELGEACDGADLGGQSCADQGFLWGHLSCTSDCELDTSTCSGTCGDDVLDPREDCDGSDLGGQTCLTAAGAHAGALGCTSTCHLDVSACHTCGDGVIEADEQCDGPSLRGASCQSLGYDLGVLGCRGDCTLDTTGCGPLLCGDGQVTGTEDCDGGNLNGEDCVSLGFGSGALGCDGLCAFDTTGCVPLSCGDGLVTGVENCDGTNLGGQDCLSLGFDSGTLDCAGDCTFDTTGCDILTCGDGQVTGVEQCDGTNLDGEDCVSLGFDSGTLDCAGNCTFDTTACADFFCGDGLLTAPEDCDGTNLGGQDCLGLGFDSGTLDCAGDCTFDTTGCADFFCGDGLLTAPEGCDGTNLGGESCFSLGLGTGALSCDASCLLDTTACVPMPTDCGNGYVAAAEECDDGNTVSGDGCDASCNTEPGYYCYDDPSTCVVEGEVLFVDCGVPCNGAGTLADPFCSIQLAVDNAASGQLLWLLPSTCVEDVQIPVAGDVVISGDASALWSGAGCPALDIYGQVLLYGIHQTEGILVRAGGSLTLRFSELGPSAGACEGVFCSDSSYCEIVRSHIHGHSKGGIFTNGGSFRIVNNFIVDNGTSGPAGSNQGGVRVMVPQGPPESLLNNTVAYNRARTNQPGGVKCWGNADVRNNIVWMNDQEEIGPNCEPWYNIVSDPIWHNVQGNQNLDPLFVDQPGGDYHIQPLSSAIDSGDPSGIPPAPPADFDGESRFLGNGVDCGADEAG
ncbi:MAG: DUF4215 domain-containing protein [bacterium]